MQLQFKSSLLLRLCCNFIPFENVAGVKAFRLKHREVDHYIDRSLLFQYVNVYLTKKSSTCGLIEESFN